MLEDRNGHAETGCSKADGAEDDNTQTLARVILNWIGWILRPVAGPFRGFALIGATQAFILATRAIPIPV